MSEMVFAEAFPTPAREQWRQAVDKVLKGASFEEALVGRSADGFAIQPLYEKASGSIVPGRKPGTPWRVTVRVDHYEAELAASSALAELEGGATSLALVMAGNRFARGHGLTARTVDDLDRVLADVDLGLIHLWIEPSPGPGHADLIAALIARRGLAPEGLDIDFGVDPLGEAGSTGSAPANDEKLSEQLADIFDRLRGRGFNGPIFRADGRGYHEAGASEGQELACVLATLVFYLRALEGRGVVPLDARAAMSAVLAADGDQLLTIAKFRALRRLWDQVQLACGMAPVPIALHAETSWRMLTRRDPWVNILRGAVATFSAGVGGADSIAALPFDLAIGLPDSLGRRIARNTQLIFQHESHLWRVVDPAAGSGGIEAMTDELCRVGWQLFQGIERKGGMSNCVVGGAIADMLEPTRQVLQHAVATCSRPITGTSSFPNLAELRIERPAGAVISSTTPGASLGRRVPILPSFRLSERFEEMRDRSEAAIAGKAGPPRVFIAEMGERKHVTARSTYAQRLFATGGITSIFEHDLDTEADDIVMQVVARWKASGSGLFCLCASPDVSNSMPYDAAHPADTLAQAIGRSLRQAGAGLLVYANDADEATTALRAAGFSQFVHEGCDVIALLDASLTAHSSWSSEP